MSPIPLAVRSRRLLSSTLFFGLLTLAACQDAPEAEAEPDALAADPAEALPDNTLLGAVRNAGLSTFETAVRQAGLDRTLEGEGPFTVLAPTDEAFAALPPALLDTLMADENRDRLAELLRYHVVRGRIEAGSIAGTLQYNTVHGAPVTLVASADGVAVTDGEGGRARVVTNDINAENGVLHTVDRVLMPGAYTPSDSAAAVP